MQGHRCRSQETIPEKALDTSQETPNNAADIPNKDIPLLHSNRQDSTAEHPNIPTLYNPDKARATNCADVRG
jgi:hypothetical protein